MSVFVCLCFCSTKKAMTGYVRVLLASGRFVTWRGIIQARGDKTVLKRQMGLGRFICAACVITVASPPGVKDGGDRKRQVRLCP